MADLRISELATLAGANLAAGDFLPIADTSASETKKITVTDLVGNATTLIADATIPSAKILFGANTIPGSSLTNTSVNTTQLANDAVTAAKLADESSVDLVTTLPASGAFVGQIALDTDDSKIYCWDGSSWVSVKGAGSVNAVLGSTAGVINIVSTTVGDQVTISATLDNTTAAAEFLAGPTASAGTVGYRPIVGADLPTATTTTKGAVIVNGNGLTLSGDTITINNSVTAEQSDYHIVQYNAKGLVTAGRVIDSGDIPIATSSTNGIVKPGTGLNVTNTGTVNHTNAVGAGAGVKVSFDAEGHVTGVSVLAEADIPNLSAAKITTGTLDIERIATNAIIGAKLADYSVSKIGSSQPSPDHIGQFFFNPLSRDLFLWDGNVYQPIGISAGEIVFAGTYDATTNLLTSVTSEGAVAGFVNGSALPAASAGNSRYYVVVANSGTGTAPAPTVALQPPDILLSNGTNYILIDVSQTVTSQTASNVVFNPTGSVSANNVQGAIAEVDGEKLAKAGDTLTGQLLIGNTGSLVFEGATDNAFETTLAVTDPTADRTITLPDVTGTVVTTGDTGSVTSTMILDGTILDADVNASAAIAGTKISPDFGSQNVTTTGTITGASFIPSSSTAPTNGLYLASANQLAFSTNSTERLRIDASGQIQANSLGTAGAPIISFVADPNTGIYSPGADQVAISTGGSQRLTIDASGRLLAGASTSSSVNRAVFQGNSTLSTGTAIVQLSLGNSSPASGDQLGRFQFTDSNQESSAEIIAARDGGTWNTSTSRPTRLVLSTTADGASSPTERLRITSAGLVGIGSTTPGSTGVDTGSAQLYVVAPNSSFGPAATLITDSLGRGCRIADQSKTYGFGIDVNSTSAFVYTTTASTPLTFGVNNSERARLDTSGRLLVGTSTARTNTFNGAVSQALQIEGTNDTGRGAAIFSSLNSPDGSYFVLGHQRSGTIGGNTILNNADEFGLISFQGNDGSEFVEGARITAAVDGTPGANDMPGRLVFSTTADGASSPTERMRITSNGNLFVNTTTPLINESQISASGSGNTACLKTTVSGNNPLLLWNSATSGDNVFCSFFTEASFTGRGTIDYNRGAGQVRYNTTSDRRLKSDIASAPTALSKLNEIKVKSYKWTETDYLVEYGFIAQELNVVLPDAVKKGDDGDEVVEPWAVDNSKLVPLLTKALQEAITKVETLEARLTALESA